MALSVSSAAARLVSRRCFSAAAAIKKVEERVAGSAKGKKMSSAAESPAPQPPSPAPWVPDPATGYYRPASTATEVDAADLRRRLLPGR